jgi:hypothetical protein
LLLALEASAPKQEARLLSPSMTEPPSPQSPPTSITTSELHGTYSPTHSSWELPVCHTPSTHKLKDFSLRGRFWVFAWHKSSAEQEGPRVGWSWLHSSFIWVWGFLPLWAFCFSWTCTCCPPPPCQGSVFPSLPRNSPLKSPTQYWALSGHSHPI